MLNTTAMLDGLRERGFSPEDELEEGWFSIPVGAYKVRVVMDGAGITVLLITAVAGTGLWYAAFGDAVPLSVVTTTIDLAIADAVTRDAREAETV